ncbi:hypothetical protein ACWD4N_14625 [Streptomyces sp. NPDC002586]
MKTKRILATVGVVVAAGVAPLVTATSASANVVTCDTYLGNHGYQVGPLVERYCEVGSSGWINVPVCVSDLINIRVKPDDALTACRLADSK